MADRTSNLDIPFILPAQAQKHVTHNEALLKLDALVHLTITSEIAAPPASPADGARHLVGSDPTGEFTGKAGQIASRHDGAWYFAQPRQGWVAWFVEPSVLKVFSGTAWNAVPLPPTGSLGQLGINTSADATNRLALAAEASLFSHTGSSHRLKINKAASTDTASLLFQSGWTGHAEMGLAGDDMFSIKVSDGSTWKSGLTISNSGHVSRPNQPTARAFRTGTTFTPSSGQKSGWTNLPLNHGGFTLGAGQPGGGNALNIPADGTYLVTINISLITSAGYTLDVTRNASDVLLTLSGGSGGVDTKSVCGIFDLQQGDVISMTHGGSAQFQMGAGKSELSISML